jgi:tRNA-splicing endonuclease subunit Sen54
VPTLSEISDLFSSVPYDAPPEKFKTMNYQKLKHGYRNCILAVVDQGVTSFLRVGDAAFGEERLYERFDAFKSGRRGGKGGKGRGGGRGRGRGRGR